MPLNIAPMFSRESDDISEHKLFMSSTIFGGERFLKKLGLSDKPSKIIYLDSKFPVENRQVFSMQFKNVNSALINSQGDELYKFFDKVKKIIIHHAQHNESGIIFSVSYGLTKLLVEYIYKDLENKNIKVLYNLNSNERDDVIEKFTNREDCIVKVLISPSFYEGVNLEGDISKYQIVLKVPYKSLGSKYVKAQLELDPIEYQLCAAKQVVQACGRSIRNENDEAITYILDKN